MVFSCNFHGEQIGLINLFRHNQQILLIGKRAMKNVRRESVRLNGLLVHIYCYIERFITSIPWKNHF